MRVVVTGALGYVGARLVRELTDVPSMRIVMVDDQRAGHCVAPHELTTRACTFVRADILDADLDAVFAGADAVVHLAALTHGCAADDMRRVNVDGTMRVAAACLASGAALLFPSTTSVYRGSGGVIDDGAEDVCVEPQTPYAALKLETERRLQTMMAKGLGLAILRMATIFGPSPALSTGTAVNHFCRAAVDGERIRLWRTAPAQYRPYLDLEDAVRAIAFLLNRRYFDGHILNVVTTNATAGQVLATLAMFAPELTVERADSPLMNTQSYQVRATRLSNMGFECRGSLERGIGATVAALTAQCASFSLSAGR